MRARHGLDCFWHEQCLGRRSKRKEIAAGGRHTATLKSDGTVWNWGDNTYGQLGDGTTTSRYTRVQVSGLTDVKSITEGVYSSIALKKDGTVWAWGANYDGELGDGTTTTRYTPVQGAWTGVIAVTAFKSAGVTLALRSDGTVWGVGNNSMGQLGDGTTTNRLTPVQVSGLSDVIAISAGAYQALALKSDGTVWAWGTEIAGELGNGGNLYTTSAIPVQVSGLTNVTTISAGFIASYAVKANGTVWAWGQGGHLGDGTNTPRATPVQVTGLSDMVMVAGGTAHAIALKSNGMVWAWGVNGLVGDGTSAARLTPVQVIGLTDIKSISVGLPNHQSIALKTNGTVWAWGNNEYGKLGDGTTINRLAPVQVTGLP